MDGTVVGTPYYMPPEQAAGRMIEIDERSDVYAAGALLYHLLAGRPPYAEPGRSLDPLAVLARVLQGPPRAIQVLAPDAPAEICAICEKAMARAPRDRYANMSQLAEDLSAYLEGRVVRAYETGALAEARKWVQRNKALSTACAAAIALLVIGLAASLFLKNQSDRNATWARDSAALAQANAIKAQEQTDAAKSSEQEARAALDLAEGARLLTLANDVLGRDPELALLLAIEGAERKPGREANDLLVSALGAAGLLTTAREHDGPIAAMASTADGKRLATAGRDTNVVLWDLERRRPLHSLRGHSAGVVQLAFSNSGAFLASLSSPGEIILWDVAMGRRIRRVSAFAWPVSIAFEGDSAKLDVQTSTGFVRTWDAATGREVEPSAEGRLGRPLQFRSPDGRFGLLVRAEKPTQVLELSSSTVVHELVPITEVLSSAAFSSDGAKLATAGGTAGVSILDTRTWTEVGAIVSYDQPAFYTRFSRDGRWIMSASFGEHVLMTGAWRPFASGRSVRVFDAATLGPWLSVNPTESAQGFSVALFEETSASLLVGQEDGTIAWVPLDPLGEARRLAPRQLSSIELRRFALSAGAGEVRR